MTATKPPWLESPSELGTGAARRHWQRLADDLYQTGYLTEGSIESLKALCRFMAVIDSAMNEIETTGVTVQSKGGTKRANPAISIMLQTQPQVDRLLREFGIQNDALLRKWP